MSEDSTALVAMQALFQGMDNEQQIEFVVRACRNDPGLNPVDFIMDLDPKHSPLTLADRVEERLGQPGRSERLARGERLNRFYFDALRRGEGHSGAVEHSREDEKTFQRKLNDRLPYHLRRD